MVEFEGFKQRGCCYLIPNTASKICDYMSKV